MNDVNVEELYQKFNPLLLKTAKGKMFVEVLGEEDAYQEACLAFMEVIRRAERETPDLLYTGRLFPAIYRAVSAIGLLMQFITNSCAGGWSSRKNILAHVQVLNTVSGNSNIWGNWNSFSLTLR